MAEPVDPGTQPTLLGDPVNGAGLAAPRFVFADDTKPRDVGPFGPRPEDRSTREAPPLLGIAGPAASPRSFVLTTSIGTPVSAQRVDVVKPTLLLLWSTDILTTDVSINLLYFPSVAFERYLDDNNGLKFRGPDIFLWAPGSWYLGAILTAGPRKLTYLMVETEHPGSIDYFREQASCFHIQNSHVVLAAAVIGTLVDVLAVLKCRRIVLQNVGANPAFWLYGSAAPSATRGDLLAPNQTTVLEGSGLSTAQIRAFSTLGTSIAVHLETNPWPIF